jgi:hypothetical protein
MAYNVYFERRRDGVVYRKVTVRGKVTDITFDPDHEKLASFVPKMRDGTKIRDKDFGLRFRWHDGKLVSDVDEAALEQIDRITEEIMAEGEVPDGLATDKKTEAGPNNASAAVDELPDTVESREKVMGESRSFQTPVFCLIGLSIIAIIAWRVFLVKGR